MPTPEQPLLLLARQRFPAALDRFLSRHAAAAERLAAAVR